LQTSLLQARDVAAALVDEAIESGVDAILVGLPYRKRFGGDFVIGRTIPYVLKHAPCEVWIVREPIPAEPVPMAATAGGRKEQG
jgi:nucleotide-binding universal stress UspA family protein